MFDAKQARRDLKRWRTKGLTEEARDAVEFLARERVDTLLEIGGGIGAAQVELLRRGVERATNVELSPAYEEVALGARARGGVEERIERRVGDAVTAELPDADAVLLNRVVCCYPDYEALLAGVGVARAPVPRLHLPAQWGDRLGGRRRREPAAAPRASRFRGTRTRVRPCSRRPSGTGSGSSTSGARSCGRPWRSPAEESGGAMSRADPDERGCKGLRTSHQEVEMYTYVGLITLTDEGRENSRRRPST